MKLASMCLAAALALTSVILGDATAKPAKNDVVLPTTVDDFRLTDQDLHSHQLSLLSDANAVVLITQQDSCPVSRNIASSVTALQQQYADKGVEFFLLNSTPTDKREDIVAEANEYGYHLPILMDTYQLVGEQLGVTRTAEAIIIDPKTLKILYRGPIDDRVTYERQKAKADHTWAKDALDATLAGKKVAVSQVAPVGCLISFTERAKLPQTNISYAKTIAPMIQDKCVSCHQPGGIGPMPLISYETIKPFAPMIREMIRTQRMPPWRADPSVGHFLGDKSLNADQIKTMVHWVEAGALRGDGADPLAAQTYHVEEWPLGPPDLVLDVPAFTIPATGIVNYQRPWVLNPLTEGKWLRASTIKVENRQTVHHILTGYMSTPPAPGEEAVESRWESSVGGYAVGAESTVQPPDTGVYLPPGGAIGFQVHYTPFGKEVTEHSKIALYFYQDVPKLVMRSSVVLNPNISIPANTESAQFTAYLTFKNDALLYSAFPHAHYRGSSSKLYIQTPDGKRTLLLALPHYDFNWQREYDFAEPISVPAGSKMIAVYTYDNSVRNPANPDHNRVVPWGDQSFDEMMYTALRYRWVGETSDRMKDYVAYDKALNSDRLFGILDSKVNGKLDESELIGRMGSQFKPYFSAIDTNHDGFIEPDELAAAQAYAQRMRAPAGTNSSVAPAPTAPAAAAPAAAPPAKTTGGN
jgi:peroxiredoxin